MTPIVCQLGTATTHN